MAVKTQECTACGETKPHRDFGRRSMTVKEAEERGMHFKTMVPRDICLVCEIKADRVALRNEQRDHQRAALEKTIRKEERRKAVGRAKSEIRRAEKEKTRAESARTEMLARELARKSLLGFTKRFSPNYMAGWVHVDICNRLERFVKQVERRENPRLMLFMPPRHGKSNIASQHFPAWSLGHHPDWEIIAASYGSSLPIKFSRYVRGLLRDPSYQVLFPDTILDKENENVEGWGTTKRGGYIPAGVSGGITGKGAHILIIDDPVKDAEQADSEIVRESAWDWYGSTALTRLAPQSGVLMIQTRWHDDDLSGRAIAQMREAYKELDGMEREVEEILNAQFDADEIDEVKYSMMLTDAKRAMRERREEVDTWEIISYPALAEFDEYQDPSGKAFFVDPDSDTVVVPDSVFVPKHMRVEEPDLEACRLLRLKGEALHPARYPVSQLKRRKNAMQPRHWHALYQQNPVPDEGDYFKKDDFRYHIGPFNPISSPIGITWDLAVGKKQVNDYTVGLVAALDYQGNIQLIDMVRGRWDTHESAAKILELYQKYRRLTANMVLCGIERGQLELAVKPELNRLQVERNIFPNYDPDLKPLTDKLVRARPAQGRLEAHKIIFADPQENPWVEILTHEMLRFPNGTFDDTVDSLAWMARMMESKFSIPKPPNELPVAHRRKDYKSTKQRVREELSKHIRGNDPMAA